MRPNEMFDLSGKVALITGGSRGLGREMALAFADAGADIVIASRKLDECTKAVAEVEAKGRKGMAYAVHVGDWDALTGLVDAAYERFGHVDVLVNNAGMSPLYPRIEDVTEALYDKVLDVNLKGPFRLTQLVGSRMAAGDGGSVINISSVASWKPTPDVIPYAAAKRGLNAITEGFAWTWRGKVRVNCIVAGPFLTDISKAWDMKGFEASAQLHVAMGRGGQPDEIVGAALYFASDASSFTTGALLSVSGGQR
jgi:NAD(P)-dependent dehydrogenase (short-subunit alcohol dehydrogenase family)